MPRTCVVGKHPTEAVSVGLRLYLDDLRIGAGTVAVICPQPVVIIGVRRQSDNVSTGDVANVQVLLSRHVSDKTRIRILSHIQPVTCRNAKAVPVRGETGGFDVSCILCLRSRRCWTRRYRCRCHCTSCRCRGWRGSPCTRSRHDLNSGEVRVVDTCRCDNVEHSVRDRYNERSLHRGKLPGYRPDIKILENSLPFYADIKHTLPGAVEIYFSKYRVTVYVPLTTGILYVSVGA